MAGVSTVQVRIVLTNMSAIRRLAEAAELVRDMQEDMPWREEPTKAADAIEYAVKHLQAE